MKMTIQLLFLELQEASAGCLKNIRELALRAEEMALQF